MNVKISKNNPICGCNGNINIYATEGFPPYIYSVDSGLTFHNAPSFKNLCDGLYTVTTIDVSGNTVTSSVTLDRSPLPVVYSVILNKGERTTVNTTNVNTKVTDITITVTPPLPDSAYITFDLVHTNTFSCSPTSTAATVSTNSILTKNTTGVTVSSSGTTTGTTFNTYPGCQDQTVFINTYSEQWSGLQINNTDSFSLSTSTTVTKNVDVSCYYYAVGENYSVANLSISNCSCCRVRKI